MKFRNGNVAITFFENAHGKTEHQIIVNHIIKMIVFAWSSENRANFFNSNRNGQLFFRSFSSSDITFSLFSIGFRNKINIPNIKKLCNILRIIRPFSWNVPATN